MLVSLDSWMEPLSKSTDPVHSLSFHRKYKESAPKAATLIHWGFTSPSLKSFNSNFPSLPLILRWPFTKPLHFAFKIAKSPEVPLIKKEHSVFALWVGTFEGSAVCFLVGTVDGPIVWAVASTSLVSNPWVCNISTTEMAGFLQCTTL